MRVLVVEHQALVAAKLHDELTRAGHEVLGPVIGSREAIRMAEKLRPALAIVDLDLEEKAVGLDVTEHLSAMLDVDVIICTAQVGIARHAQSGAIGLISKPYAPGMQPPCWRSSLRREQAQIRQRTHARSNG